MSSDRCLALQTIWRLADAYAAGQRLTSARCSDFGYLASCDGCCDDAEDFLLEVLGGESKNSLSRVGLRAASVQHAGLRNVQPLAVHYAIGHQAERRGCCKSERRL